MRGIGGTLSWANNRVFHPGRNVLVQCWRYQEGWERGRSEVVWVSVYYAQKEREAGEWMKQIPLCDPLPLWTGHTLPAYICALCSTNVPIAPALPHHFPLSSPLNKPWLTHFIDNPHYSFFRGTKEKQNAPKQISVSFGTALLSLHPSFTALLPQTLYRACLQPQLNIGLQQASSWPGGFIL